MSKDKIDEPMDFGQFLLAETSTVEINLPNGDPMLYEGKRVTAHVYGPASAEHARASAEVQRAARDKLLGKKGAKSDADEDLESDARFLVRITANLENFPYPGGLDAVFRNRRLSYIGDQIRAHVGDQGNFYRAAAKS